MLGHVLNMFDRMNRSQQEMSDRIPRLLLANLGSYGEQGAGDKGRQTMVKAGSALAAAIGGNDAATQLPTSGSEPPALGAGLTSGAIPIDRTFGGADTQVELNPRDATTITGTAAIPDAGIPTDIYSPPPGAGADNLDVGGGPNYGSVSPSYPVPGSGTDPYADDAGFPYDPKNIGPVTDSGPGPTQRFLPPVLGTVGGIGGMMLGGPLGAVAGRIGGTLLGKLIASGALDNMDMNARRYDPNAPVSVSNIPPFAAGGRGVFPTAAGGNVAYQQSGSIMDRSRGGVDPNTALFTNSIGPFGPGRIGSSGNVFGNSFQGDQMAQGALQARLADGAGSDRVLNDTLPDTPFFNLLASLNGAGNGNLPPISPTNPIFGLPPAPPPPGP
jgi:hypothetical protein